MAVDGLQASRTATKTPSSSQVAPECEPHVLGGAVTAAIAARHREQTGRQARPPALDMAGRVAAASRAPYATLTHDELLVRARNEGEARSKNARLLIAANLAKIKLKTDLTSARKKLELLEKATAKEARAREKRASQLAKAAAGGRVVVQIGPEQIEMARGMCKAAGINDFLGNFTLALLNGRLHPCSPYGARLSDGSYNILQASARHFRFPLTKLQFSAMHASESTTASLNINNGLQTEPLKRGEPTPTAQTSRTTRRTRLQKFGKQNNVVGFLQGNCSEMVLQVVESLQKQSWFLEQVKPDSTLPFSLAWDFTDCKGTKRFAKDGSFINDADTSEFDSDAPSPKVLEGVYKRLAKALRDVSSGGGTAGELLACAAFIAREMRPMLDQRHELLLKLSKMLARHERRRSGASGAAPKRKPKELGKVAAAREAAQALGAADASISLDAAAYDSAKAALDNLKGRLVSVLASEYTETDELQDAIDLPIDETDGNGSSDDPVVIKIVGVITGAAEVDGAVMMKVTFPQTDSFSKWKDDFELDELLTRRLVSFADSTRDQLVAVGPRLLQREAQARVIAGRSKMTTAAALADALLKEFERVSDAADADANEGAATPDDDDTPGSDDSGGTSEGTEQQLQPPDAAGGVGAAGNGAGGDGAASGGGGAPCGSVMPGAGAGADAEADEVSAGAPGGDADDDQSVEQLLAKQLLVAADQANQQQIVALEKLYAAVLASTRRCADAATLLQRMGWPEDLFASAPAVSPVAGDATHAVPPVPSCAWRLLGELQPAQLQMVETGLRQMSALATGAQSVLRDVVWWKRRGASKMLLIKIRDFRNMREATIARFGVCGQMETETLKKAIAWAVAKVEAEGLALQAGAPARVARASGSDAAVLPFPTIRIDWLCYDGEACNLKANPRPGKEPHSLHELGNWAEERLKEDKARLGKNPAAQAVCDLIRTYLDPRPLPLAIQKRLGFRLHPSATNGSCTTSAVDAKYAAVTFAASSAASGPAAAAAAAAATAAAANAANATVEATDVTITDAAAEDVDADDSAAPATTATAAADTDTDTAAAETVVAADDDDDEDMESADLVYAIKWFERRCHAKGSVSAALMSESWPADMPRFLRSIFGTHALLLPPVQRSKFQQILRVVQPADFNQPATIFGNPLPNPDQQRIDAEYLFVAEDCVGASCSTQPDGHVTFRLRSAVPSASCPASTAFVKPRMLLYEQQLRAAPAAVAAKELSMSDLYDELLNAIYQRKRRELTEAGIDLASHYVAPTIELPGGRILELQCTKHKSKNLTQGISRQKTPGVISLKALLTVARQLEGQDPNNFYLIAPFIRTTDMQCSASMIAPMLTREYLSSLRAAGHVKEHAILLSVGLAYRAWDMKGLSYGARTLLIEAIHFSMCAHVYGSSLFLPFGGGVTRERSGALAGVRAGSVQGLAGTNVRAMLEAADGHFAFRERYGEPLAGRLCQKTSNTDHLEGTFATYVRLMGGEKGEFDQMLSMSVRADFLETLKNDPSLAFTMATSSRADMYDDAELQSETQASRWADGSCNDPRSEGWQAYDAKKQKVALKAATARDEGVRRNFKGKGIGASAA